MVSKVATVGREGLNSKELVLIIQLYLAMGSIAFEHLSRSVCRALSSSESSFTGPPKSIFVHFPPLSVSKWNIRRRKGVYCRMAMEGPAASLYAKQMERRAAKESLFLAIKDAGGFDVLLFGNANDIDRIDVNERVISLERLNPTPRPTTSPFLEGLWQFQWFGADSLGLFAVKFLLERFPSALASIKQLDLLIMDGYAKSTAGLKFLNLFESNFILTTKLSVEGPLRLKEEYIDGVIETPNVPESSIPSQLKDSYGQVLTAFEQLPASVKETLSSGLKIPLSGTFQRLFIISYLDEEMLIVRDIAGVPSILSRLDGSPVVTGEVTEYES